MLNYVYLAELILLILKTETDHHNIVEYILARRYFSPCIWHYILHFHLTSIIFNQSNVHPPILFDITYFQIIDKIFNLNNHLIFNVVYIKHIFKMLN